MDTVSFRSAAAYCVVNSERYGAFFELSEQCDSPSTELHIMPVMTPMGSLSKSDIYITVFNNSKKKSLERFSLDTFGLEPLGQLKQGSFN